jgi:DNA-directed RNA polymerase II subunit RPB1
LNVIFNICKTKTICETGEDEDPQKEQQSDDPLGEHKKKPHGGCGNYQPKVTRDGLKLTAEFKNVIDESIEKKQLLTAEKV